MRNNWRIVVEDTVTGRQNEMYVPVTEKSYPRDEDILVFVATLNDVGLSNEGNPLKVLSVMQCREVYSWSLQRDEQSGVVKAG